MVASQSSESKVAGKRFTDRVCLVTDTFGLPTSGRLPVPAILRVWRPSLPLP